MLPGGIPAEAIIATDEAVRKEWQKFGTTPKGPLVAVRFPPNRHPPVEVFVTAESPHQNVVFFAGARPSQIYAVARHKCSSDVRASVAGKSADFYVISETEEDAAVSSAKTAMRPIGCDISELNTGMTRQRVFAAKEIAPAAAVAFFGD